MLRKAGGAKQSSDGLCGSAKHVLQLAGRCSYVHVGDRRMKKKGERQKKKNDDNIRENRESEGLLGCQPCEAASGV